MAHISEDPFGALIAAVIVIPPGMAVAALTLGILSGAFNPLAVPDEAYREATGANAHIYTSRNAEYWQAAQKLQQQYVHDGRQMGGEAIIDTYQVANPVTRDPATGKGRLYVPLEKRPDGRLETIGGNIIPNDAYPDPAHAKAGGVWETMPSWLGNSGLGFTIK
jgi:hypothetical protein